MAVVWLVISAPTSNLSKYTFNQPQYYRRHTVIKSIRQMCRAAYNDGRILIMMNKCMQYDVDKLLLSTFPRWIQRRPNSEPAEYLIYIDYDGQINMSLYCRV